MTTSPPFRHKRRTYLHFDLQPFAEDCGSDGPPTEKDGNFLPFEFWKQNIPSHIHPPRNE